MVTTLMLSAFIAQATAYRINPAASEAGFDLKATMHTVHGVTKRVSGEIHAELEGDGGLRITGRIEIDAATLVTGNDKRDATMHGKSLLVPSFPSIVFSPAHFSTSGAAADGAPVSGTLTGQLTIRGKTRSQSMAVTLTPQGGRISVAGTFDVAWADFGIPDPSFFVVRIEDTAHAHFRADFVPLP